MNFVSLIKVWKKKIYNRNIWNGKEESKKWKINEENQNIILNCHQSNDDDLLQWWDLIFVFKLLKQTKLNCHQLLK